MMHVAGALLLAILWAQPCHRAVADTGAGNSVATSAAAIQPPANPSQSPLSDPVLTSDCELKGRRVTAWAENEVRYLLLEGDAAFAIGLYAFRADRAVVRVIAEPTEGVTLYHIAGYLDDARLIEHPTMASVAADAKRLLVTATIQGELKLSTDLMVQRTGAGHPLTIAATKRFAMFDRAVVHGHVDRALPDDVFKQELETVRPMRRDALRIDAQRRTPTIRVQSRADTPEAKVEAKRLRGAVVQTQRKAAPANILPAKGTIAFNAKEIVYDRGERAVMLKGAVRVMYYGDPDARSMSLRAENAVIFLSGEGEVVGNSTDAGRVTGVYLEDNVVATDGEFTVRAPRVFYDVPRNRAMLLQAVVYAYDVRRNVPLYLRAERITQEAQRVFTARNAIVTTSDFAEPHIAIGADVLRVERRLAPDGEMRDYITARGVKAKVGNMPIGYFPKISGRIEKPLVRRVSVGFEDRKGVVIETQWDAFALLGRETPEGVDARFRFDVQGNHAVGIGLDLSYDRPQMFGETHAYLLPYDGHEDRIGDRLAVDHDGDTRGFINLRHRQHLSSNLDLTLELAYVSDETLLEEFFRPYAETDKPWETVVYLKQHEENWAATVLTQHNLMDFVPQTTTLQAPGYATDKALELGHHLPGLSVWDDRLTFYSNTTLGYIRIRGGADTPRDRGFTDAESMELFDIGNATSFKDAVFATGIDSDWRLRFDSRHEIQAPLDAGPLNVTPYLIGRVTAYDDDFAAFGGEDDLFRLMGTVGVRSQIELHRAYADADSRLLDVHGIRHIVQPHADVFLTGSTIDPEDIPVYDFNVEGVTEGFGARFGVRNTFQTRRGGLGRWRTVDWVVINTDIVMRSDDAPTAAPIARYFGYRPEYTIGGDHINVDLRWMVTEAVAMAGEMLYSLESDRVEQWRLGIAIQHSRRLDSFVNYRDIRPLDSQLLSYGLRYRMTDRYSFGIAHTIDLGSNDANWFVMSIERRLPHLRVIVSGGYDEIDDEAIVMLRIEPMIGVEPGLSDELWRR